MAILWRYEQVKHPQPAPRLNSQTNANPNIPTQVHAERDGKNSKRVAKERPTGVGRKSANYWIRHLFKPLDSEGMESPHFSMKVQYPIGNRFPGLRCLGPEFAAGSGDFHARSAPDEALSVKRPGEGRLEMRASDPPLQRGSDGSTATLTLVLAIPLGN